MSFPANRAPIIDRLLRFGNSLEVKGLPLVKGKMKKIFLEVKPTKKDHYPAVNIYRQIMVLCNYPTRVIYGAECVL